MSLEKLGKAFERVNLQFNLLMLVFSFGTFGLVTAFLKEGGDVILADGTSNNSSFLAKAARTTFQNWIVLNDPCFFRAENKTVFRKENCL